MCGAVERYPAPFSITSLNEGRLFALSYVIHSLAQEPETVTLIVPALSVDAGYNITHLAPNLTLDAGYKTIHIWHPIKI